MNAEQAKFLADYLTRRHREGEFPATAQGAGGGEGRQPRLQARRQVAHARGSWRRTWRRPTSGSSTASSTAPSTGTPRARSRPRRSSRRVNDVVAFYKRDVSARAAALRALPGDKLTRTIGLLRHHAAAGGAGSSASPTTTACITAAAGRVPARHGLEGAAHLRRQRRRSDAGDGVAARVGCRFPISARSSSSSAVTTRSSRWRRPWIRTSRSPRSTAA